MGVKVTAEQAGQLVDRHERIVRWHIKRGTLPAVKRGTSWRIDVDDLERVPGWTVNRQRLGELQHRDSRTAESMAARLNALEREVAALRTRLRVLEASQNGHQHAQDDNLTVRSYAPLSVPTYTTESQHSASSSVPDGVPEGSMRLKSFCRQHNLISQETTIARRMDQGKLPVILRDEPMRPGSRRGQRVERWLSPEHQRIILEAYGAHE